MFTGLIRESAEIVSIEKRGAGIELIVKTALPEAAQWALGDSIACNGTCLTITHNTGDGTHRLISFELSPETLDRTTFAFARVGTRIHIEPALRIGEALGGHMVSGHVDAVGSVEDAEWTHTGDYFKVKFCVESPAREKIAPYLVEKGSIAVDGVSLTVNEVMDWQDKTLFSVYLIPHTLSLTTFKGLEHGTRVNLEVDMVAKYVTRSLEFAKYQHSTHDAQHS